MLVGTKQVIQEIPIRNAVLRLYCKSNGKRQIFKICKRISRSLFKCFQQIFRFCFVSLFW